MNLFDFSVLSDSIRPVSSLEATKSTNEIDAIVSDETIDSSPSLSPIQSDESTIEEDVIDFNQDEVVNSTSTSISISSSDKDLSLSPTPIPIIPVNSTSISTSVLDKELPANSTLKDKPASVKREEKEMGRKPIN